MEKYETKILKDVIKQLEIIQDRIENVHNGTKQKLNDAQEYLQDAINVIKTQL